MAASYIVIIIQVYTNLSQTVALRYKASVLNAIQEIKKCFSFSTMLLLYISYNYPIIKINIFISTCFNSHRHNSGFQHQKKHCHVLKSIGLFEFISVTEAVLEVVYIFSLIFSIPALMCNSSVYTFFITLPP